MSLVAPDLLEPAAVLAAELDQDAAIALAEDARRRFPVGSARGGYLGRHRLLRGGKSIFWIPDSILRISWRQWPQTCCPGRSEATSTSVPRHARSRRSAKNGRC